MTTFSDPKKNVEFMHLIYVSSVMNISSKNFNGFILLGLDSDMGFETTSWGQLELSNCIVWSLTWYRIFILYVLFLESPNLCIHFKSWL